MEAYQRRLGLVGKITDDLVPGFGRFPASGGEGNPSLRSECGSGHGLSDVNSGFKQSLEASEKEHTGRKK